MLQAAMRNREVAYDTRHTPPVGEELKRAARRLHDAISHMEAAVARPRTIAAAPENNEEHQQLATAYAHLQQENAELAHRLSDMRTRHAEVSQQVIGLSARLEALISRLGRLLEE